MQGMWWKTGELLWPLHSSACFLISLRYFRKSCLVTSRNVSVWVEDRNSCQQYSTLAPPHLRVTALCHKAWADHHHASSPGVFWQQGMITACQDRDRPTQGFILHWSVSGTFIPIVHPFGKILPQSPCSFWIRCVWRRVVFQSNFFKKSYLLYLRYLIDSFYF